MGMPTNKKTNIELHVERWHCNRKFAERLGEDDCDWIVTSLFYAVLHGVQACLIQRGFDPTTHRDRNHAIQSGIRNGALPKDLRRLYQALREASNHARYEPENTKYTDLKGVQSEIVDLLIVPIEKHLKKLLMGVAGTVSPLAFVKEEPKLQSPSKQDS